MNAEDLRGIFRGDWVDRMTKPKWKMLLMSLNRRKYYKVKLGKGLFNFVLAKRR